MLIALYIIGGVVYLILLTITKSWIHKLHTGGCDADDDGTPVICSLGGIFWPIVLPILMTSELICKPLFSKEKKPKQIECRRKHVPDDYKLGSWNEQ